jgi:hypothetical protein
MYTIRYKTLRGDHLKRFGELIHRNRDKIALTASGSGGPMLLPFPNEEVETAGDNSTDPKPDGTGQEGRS